jgi:hypothetical protein
MIAVLALWLLLQQPTAGCLARLSWVAGEIGG